MPPKRKIIEALDEKYVQQIAKELSISLPEAVKHIDHCIQLSAAKLNLSYHIVYNEVLSQKCLVKTLTTSNGSSSGVSNGSSTGVSSATCTKLEIDECIKECNC